jgi:rhodanese-related sulfurtransferase/rubrerythrin
LRRRWRSLKHCEEACQHEEVVGIEGVRGAVFEGLEDVHEEPCGVRSDYELVDVRQPEEYDERHLPGARLLPLSELEGRLGEIRGEKHTIFYCGSGMRSQRAALLVAERRKLPNLYHLKGGLADWDGETLPDFPHLQLFDQSGTFAEVVLRAMDLEKGAERLYETLSHYFEDSNVRDVLQTLLRAEEAHARTLHGALAEVSPKPPEPFETLYAKMKGNVLESGETLEAVLAKLKGIEPSKRWALLEVALDMEFKAYDLYRNLAARQSEAKLEDMFVRLAGQERKHYEFVLAAIGTLASERAVQRPTA